MAQLPETLGAVANRYGVPIWCVRRLYESGRLPEPPRIGRYRVVAAADLPAVKRALHDAGYLPAEAAAK